MIGDGMGLNQVSAAMYDRKKPLSLEQFPVIGFQKTHSADNLITDSAAGATAMASGVKTFNGAIGLDADSMPVKSILYYAEKMEMATGIVVTSSLVHATPAAFVAHNNSRYNYEDIALDFMDTEIDFLIGGGKKYFDRRSKDTKDLYYTWKKEGYQVYNYFDHDLSSTIIKTNQNFVFFTADDQPVSYENGRKYLPFASKLAANFLFQHSEMGFFLLIEGSQIDWGGHAKNADMVIDEMFDFDQAIRNMLSFTIRNQETLLIVTADHECGGMAINSGVAGKYLDIAFTSNAHTAAMVPVFAIGPKAELFAGIYDNTEIFYKMKKALFEKSEVGSEK